MKKGILIYLIVLFVLSSFVYAGTLKVTSEHPFLINGEWIPASELKVGDRLTEINGKIVEITSIKKVTPKEPFLVYNIEAGKYHNFVVRDTDNLSIVVHNSNAPQTPLSPLVEPYPADNPRIGKREMLWETGEKSHVQISGNEKVITVKYKDPTSSEIITKTYHPDDDVPFYRFIIIEKTRYDLLKSKGQLNQLKQSMRLAGEDGNYVAAINKEAEVLANEPFVKGKVDVAATVALTLDIGRGLGISTSLSGSFFNRAIRPNEVLVAIKGKIKAKDIIAPTFEQITTLKKHTHYIKSWGPPLAYKPNLPKDIHFLTPGIKGEKGFLAPDTVLFHNEAELTFIGELPKDVSVRVYTYRQLKEVGLDSRSMSKKQFIEFRGG